MRASNGKHLRQRPSRTTRDTPASNEALAEEKSQIEEYSTKTLEQRNMGIRSKNDFFSLNFNKFTSDPRRSSSSLHHLIYWNQNFFLAHF
jgi:hypothetical protein